MNSRLEHAEHSASDVENEMDKMYPKTESIHDKMRKKRVSVMEDESTKPHRETVAGETEVQSERTNTGRNLLALKLICTWRLKGLSAYQVIKRVFSLAENRPKPKHTWVKFLKASSL